MQDGPADSPAAIAGPRSGSRPASTATSNRVHRVARLRAIAGVRRRIAGSQGRRHLPGIGKDPIATNLSGTSSARATIRTMRRHRMRRSPAAALQGTTPRSVTTEAIRASEGPGAAGTLGRAMGCWGAEGDPSGLCPSGGLVARMLRARCGVVPWGNGNAPASTSIRWSGQRNWPALFSARRVRAPSRSATVGPSARGRRTAVLVPFVIPPQAAFGGRFACGA